MSRSESSRRWLARQKKDAYVQKAKASGYRSRAAFKLIEIQEKHQLIKPGMRCLELGSAPGSWTELLATWVHSSGKIFAVDVLDMAPIPGVVFQQADIESEAFWQWCQQHSVQGFDVVLSDMAPNMTGHQATDQLRSARLVEQVVDIAGHFLIEGGSILIKVFHGSEFNHLLKELRLAFKKVKVIKPDASRQASGEVYLLGLDKRMPESSGNEERVE